MATAVLTPSKPKSPKQSDTFGRNGDGFRGGWSGGRDDSGPWEVPARAYRTGVWMALAAIVMLFAAFTSALVVRKGMSNDWINTAIPRVLYLNTLVLLTSSFTLELSRLSLSAGSVDRFKRWWHVTLTLGVAFVGGQLLAWHDLAERGVYLATNPSSSFFYLLTATHGVHLLGGIIALLYIVLRAGRILAMGKRAAVDAAAIYWHFMDGLFIYLLILLTVRL